MCLHLKLLHSNLFYYTLILFTVLTASPDRLKKVNWKIYRSFYNFTVSEFGENARGDITGDIPDLLQTWCLLWREISKWRIIVAFVTLERKFSFKVVFFLRLYKLYVVSMDTVSVWCIFDASNMCVRLSNDIKNSNQYYIRLYIVNTQHLWKQKEYSIVIYLIDIFALFSI